MSKLLLFAFVSLATAQDVGGSALIGSHVRLRETREAYMKDFARVGWQIPCASPDPDTQAVAQHLCGVHYSSRHSIRILTPAEDAVATYHYAETLFFHARASSERANNERLAAKVSLLTASWVHSESKPEAETRYQAAQRQADAADQALAKADAAFRTLRDILIHERWLQWNGRLFLDWTNEGRDYVFTE